MNPLVKGISLFLSVVLCGNLSLTRENYLEIRFIVRILWQVMSPSMMNIKLFHFCIKDENLALVLDVIHTNLVITTLQSGLFTQFLVPLMLCVFILYISGRTYSLKSTPNDRYFEKLFMAILFALRIFAKFLLRGNRRRNTF